MVASLYPLVRPLLFALDPERAHDLTLLALRLLGQMQRGGTPGALHQSIEVMGLRFANRVGLAAGMDKDGRAIDGLAALGFGFLEVGTVTPLAQPGNPKPRMFRLRSAHAVINRMGFNNAGLEQFIENIGRARYRGILGLNIGKNAQTPHEDALQDYLIGLRGVYAHASYVAINISSPNTQGLRALQNDDALDRLLGALKQEQALLQQRFGRYVPLAVKIAPDLSPEAVRHIAKQLKAHGMDGVIATNTTIDRRAVLGESHANEAGGLSGAPLTATSTQVIAHLKAELGSALPIIGVGGILTASDAIDKIRAGASLVQLYTGLVYRGPALISECLKAIDQLQDTPR